MSLFTRILIAAAITCASMQPAQALPHETAIVTTPSIVNSVRRKLASDRFMDDTADAVVKIFHEHLENAIANTHAFNLKDSPSFKFELKLKQEVGQAGASHGTDADMEYVINFMQAGHIKLLISSKITSVQATRTKQRWGETYKYRDSGKMSVSLSVVDIGNNTDKKQTKAVGDMVGKYLITAQYTGDYHSADSPKIDSDFWNQLSAQAARQIVEVMLNRRSPIRVELVDGDIVYINRGSASAVINVNTQYEIINDRGRPIANIIITSVNTDSSTAKILTKTEKIFPDYKLKRILAAKEDPDELF